ncbi:SHOCT domain-containing protein [Williamsia sp. D3]|uniref:SHOCT domain-containing protein n=1 Tax=Williamsia sp. D3 TaxID=1313067 RepID=UPI00042A68AF|nr:SHOCT domain-containing protein [Williamsia sp. D3]
MREQVMDIARRHGRPDGFAQQGPPDRPTSGRPDMSKPGTASFAPPPAAPPGPPRTPGQRLAELESMRAAGTISLEEYRAVRTRILNDF